MPASLVFNILLWVSVPLDSYHPELKLSASGNWAAPVGARWSVIISSFYMEQEWFEKTKKYIFPEERDLLEEFEVYWRIEKNRN